MDIVWFLRQRLEFIRNLYRTATAPFCETMEKIKAGEPPYVNAGNPEYDSEPPYVCEYLEASEAVEVVGHWCLIMVHTSLKAFLEDYVDQMAARYQAAFGDAKAKFSDTKASNWFERYRLFFLQEFQIDWHESPVKLEDLEEINLARNDIIHSIDVTTTYVYEKHAEGHPRTLFTNDMWIRVGKDELETASELVDDFCAWLEDIRNNYPGYIRSLEEKPTGNADH